VSSLALNHSCVLCSSSHDLVKVISVLWQWFNVTILCVEVIYTPCCPISFSDFNLKFTFGITPLNPYTSATHSIGATYNLVVDTFAVGLDIATCCFQLSLLYASPGNNPLRILNLHIQTSTWFPLLGAPLSKSCFALISNCVFSLKGKKISQWIIRPTILCSCHYI
jgi:hypothetical protein